MLYTMKQLEKTFNDIEKEVGVNTIIGYESKNTPWTVSDLFNNIKTTSDSLHKSYPNMWKYRVFKTTPYFKKILENYGFGVYEMGEVNGLSNSLGTIITWHTLTLEEACLVVSHIINTEKDENYSVSGLDYVRHILERPIVMKHLPKELEITAFVLNTIRECS